MAECPTCSAPLADNEAVCRACGCAVEGATASFAPVDTETDSSASAPPQVQNPVLVVRKGAQLGEQFFLDRPTLSVGRDPENDIFLNDMTVSRAHAVLTVSDAGVTVKDAGSLNGTYVNGVCVDSADLRNGDVLQIGTFQMAFYSGQGPSR